MNKGMGIVIGVITLFVIAGGIYASMSAKDETKMAKEKTGEQTVEDKVVTDKNAMAEKDMAPKTEPTNTEIMIAKEESGNMDPSTKNKSDTMMKKGVYEAYSADKLMRAETGDVVLFFHASWCPSCRALNTSIENNLGSIPEGISILKTDYDKENELKKKYGVTYQHTLVQVDKDGNMIKKWSGSGSLDSILSQIQ